MESLIVKDMNMSFNTGISGVYRQATIKRLTTSKEREEFRKKIEKMRERDSELVTGIFKNMENPGGSIEFNIKLYPGDDYVRYHLIDGERYQIPRGVAKHISKNCFVKEYKNMGMQNFNGSRVQHATHDGSLGGTPTWQVESKRYRFSFQSLEYMDDGADFNQNDIAQVKLAVI